MTIILIKPEEIAALAEALQGQQGGNVGDFVELVEQKFEKWRVNRQTEMEAR